MAKDVSRANQLSEYFGVMPRLLPYVADLLADFTELGSDPDLVVSWLVGKDVGPLSRVLDLGCGKGAAGIAVCQALGCRIDGVDAYAPFVAEANKRAMELGIADLCDFRVGDIRETAGIARDYDVVLLLSVGDVLGSLAECVRAVRRCVRQGGTMILDDAYRLFATALDFPGYQYLREREDALKELGAFGDKLVAEHLIPLEALKSQNRRYQALIENRGRELAEREPGLAADIAAYIEKERKECFLLEHDVQCAIWMLQRVEPTRVE